MPVSTGPVSSGITIERNGSSVVARGFITLSAMNLLRRFDLVSYLALLAFVGYLLAPLVI